MVDYQQFGSELGAMREKQTRALDLLRQILNDPETCQAIMDGALSRWEQYYQEYEGKTWDLTEEELMVELEEELMDAVNYAAVWSIHYEEGIRY